MPLNIQITNDEPFFSKQEKRKRKKSETVSTSNFLSFPSGPKLIEGKKETEGTVPRIEEVLRVGTVARV